MPSNDTWTPPEVSALGQLPDTGSQTSWQPPEVAEKSAPWTPPEVAQAATSISEIPQISAVTPEDQKRFDEQDTWLGRIGSSIKGAVTDLKASIQGRYTAAQKAFDTRYAATPGGETKPILPAVLSAAGAMATPSPGEVLNDQLKAELAVGGAQSLKETNELRDTLGNYPFQIMPVAEPGQTNFLAHSDAVQALMKPMTKEDDEIKVPYMGGEIPLSAVKAVYHPIAKTINALVTPENALIAGVTLGAGEIPAIEKAMATVFGAQMGAGSLQAVKRLQEVNSDPKATKAESVSAGIEAAIGVAMTTALVTHAISGEAKARIEELPPELQLAEVSKETGMPAAEILKSAGDQMELNLSNSKVEVPPEHVPVTIKREDGTEYQAGMVGYQDGAPVITDLTTHSTTLLKDKENIVGDLPPPELWERTSSGNKLVGEWVPPEVKQETVPTANVTVMGDHVQIDLPGEGDRPAFSGTPEQAREAGIDVSTEGLPEGKHVVPITPAPNPEVIGIRNKMIDARRKELGLEPLPKPETKRDEQLWGKAVADSLKDPELPARTVDELRGGTRVPTDQDYALLEYRAVELENANKAATDRINQAIDEGRIADSFDRLRAEETGAQLIDLHEVLCKTGTESSRGLRARQLLANRDFSLAKMVAERQSLTGEKLTPEKLAETRDIAERVKTTQAALDRITAERDALLAEKTSKAAHEDLVKKVTKESDTPDEGKSDKAKTPSKLREFIASQAEAARQRIRERTTHASAGIDPTWISDLAIIGVEHLARVGENLAAFTKRLTEDVGGWVEPHAEQIFGEAKKLRDSMVKDFTPRELVDSIGKKLSTGEDVTPEFRKLARVAIELGISDRNRVIDFVHDQIREIALEMDRRMVQDAISGYGKFRELSRDEITQKLADVSAQLRLVSKLEDILAGKEPEKTGVERRVPSEEETFLRKKIAELEKKANKDVAVSAALTREKVAIEKQITELERKVSTEDLSTKGVKVNRPAADPELEILKQRRDQLNRKLTDMRREAAPKADPTQSRLKAMKTRLENSTKDFQRRLDEGDFTTKKPRAPISDPEVEKAKAENFKVKQEYYNALAKDKFEKAGVFARTVETFLRWRRGFLLSSPITIVKLQAAAVMRVGFTLVEELVGGGLSQLPGVSKIAERAPREGGYSKEAEIQALKGIALGYKTDFMQSLKTGQSELDVLYGKQHFDVQGKSIADYPGFAHAALKAPIKRMEFERSLEKRLGWARDNGIDVYDPAVLQQIKVDAYKDANRSIFMQDSVLSDKINQFLSVEYNKVTGEATPGSTALHLVGKTLLPIVRVPTNIVAETFQYAIGLETGSIRLANAFRKGVEKLDPDQADLIMRELKKGTIGTAILLLGYFGADSIGGFYNPSNKKKPGEVKEGELRVFDEDIPKYLLHHPALETLQFAANIEHDLHAPLKISKSGIVSLKDLAKQPPTVPDAVVNSIFDLAGKVPLAHEISTGAKLLDTRTRPAAAKYIIQGIVVPQALSWIARYTDTDAQGNPIKREAGTLTEHIKEAVPGLRETLPVKQ